MDQETLVNGVTATDISVDDTSLKILLVDDSNGDVICTGSGDATANTTIDDTLQETRVDQETLVDDDDTRDGDEDHDGRLITMETLHDNNEIRVYQ